MPREAELNLVLSQQKPGGKREQVNIERGSNSTSLILLDTMVLTVVRNVSIEATAEIREEKTCRPEWMLV